MKKTFVVLLVFTLLGLLSSILMTRLHYKLGTQGLDEKSFCHVSELFDCDSALASRYSKIETPYGVFLNSEMGIIYYLLVTLGLLYAWISSDSSKRNATLAYLFISSLFAVLYNGIMAYLSIFRLGVVCLLCTTNYLASLILLIFLPQILEVRYRKTPQFIFHYVRSVFGKTEFKPRLAFHLGTTVLLLGFGVIFFKGLEPRLHAAPVQISQEDYIKSFKVLPQKEMPQIKRPVWGNPNAKVTLVEFSDFQCPFCRLAAFTLKPYLKEFQKDIRLVFINYPLDSACNPAMQQAMHPVSCLAAKAGRCADHQNKFWDYHDKVFENQKRLSRTTLLELAAEIGLDKDTFEKCLASDEVSQEIKEDIELGTTHEVHGTPTIFVNGRYFRDWTNPERLRMVIESELQMSPSKPDTSHAQ